ncbi:cytochrome-c peroxidase [Pedobacter nyackensis]|uniref:Cytochrome c peroxidase n=1 Tax=Pedobacter nyackensis TaxID=475255 RepID=A0A1W2APX8_9SPHI|nr:cytochrome c peroxidase [Pedobacter nyackensis]SMC62590.1 cytochrome c peroxidase [Pedobacter nyackensis]
MTGIKKIIVFFILIAVTTLLSIFCSTKEPVQNLQVKTAFEKELETLQGIIDRELLPAVEKKREAQIQQSFLDARKQYKKIEYYMEYFFPTTSVLVNGAPIDEIELGENLVEQPTGFQVMEELIYEILNQQNREALLNEVRKMQLNLQRTARYNAQYEITDAQVFDAVRLEILRITSLGITGFDTPTALQSLPEAASALQGIKTIVLIYKGNDRLDKMLDDAITYIQRSPDFNSFNRLDFITRHLQPISKGIDQLRQDQLIDMVSGGSAMTDDAISLFQKNALNINKFVGNYTEYISKEKVNLGKLLFNSTMLSNGGNKSCASCHHESKAFTDGLVTPISIQKDGSGKTITLLRNTPTLTYAGFQRGFFYDLKAGTLEDQALDVVHNKHEMDGSLEQASSRINQKQSFNDAFISAFGSKNATANPWKIQHALSSYIRSLAPFSSRLDKYMQGDHRQLNEEEKMGFNLFMGKAKCGSCHFAPLFNGTQSPLFNKSEAEVLGVPAKPDTANAEIDKDQGRFTLNPYPQYKYAFKTTTLRNVSKTAPYMHNGAYTTLEQVLDFYNRGGGAGIGIKLDNQTLSPDPLNLTKQEIKNIIAFLKTLDDN